MHTKKSGLPLKTAVYVDGYNLYYGRLRGTPFKWLDLVTFVDNLLRPRDQNEVLVRVNLYTAWAAATFATHGKASVQAQNNYHRAIKAKHPERFSITYGTHSWDKSGTLLPSFEPEQPFDHAKRVRVWKIEEKQTDVNIALGIYRDACRNLYDRIILATNDSDAEPTLAAIREDFPEIMIGVVMPRHPPAPGEEDVRRSSKSLSKMAHWTIEHITDEQLAGAQLPARVPTLKKPIRKPQHW